MRSRTWQQYTTVPLSVFAGHDIVQVHNRYHEQTRRQRAIIQAKRQGVDLPEQPSEEPETEEPEDEEQVVQEDDGNGEEWVDETEESKAEAQGEGQDEAEGEEDEQPEQEGPTGPTQTTYCDGCGVSVFTIHRDSSNEYLSLAKTLLALAGSVWYARVTIFVTVATQLVSMSTKCSQSNTLGMLCGSRPK